MVGNFLKSFVSNCLPKENYFVSITSRMDTKARTLKLFMLLKFIPRMYKTTPLCSVKCWRVGLSMTFNQLLIGHKTLIPPHPYILSKVYNFMVHGAVWL